MKELALIENEPVMIRLSSKSHMEVELISNDGEDPFIRVSFVGRSVIATTKANSVWLRSPVIIVPPVGVIPSLDVKVL